VEFPEKVATIEALESEKESFPMAANNGTVGSRVENHKWTEGWTTANFYTIGSKTYLFLLKERGAGADGNNVHIHQIRNGVSGHTV
jgi:hypothetical protein